MRRKYPTKLRSKFWRIVIPNLIQYQNCTPTQLQQLKYAVLQRLLAKQTKRGLQHYRIALEHHLNGVPHLDILLTYQSSKQRRLTDWDYLLRHGNVTHYRQLNKAIIQYGTKQDKQALSNFPDDLTSVLDLQQLKADPYSYLYDKMKLDPLHFNLEQYVQLHNLSKHISGWSSLKTKLKDMQTAAANLALKSKPGFRLITRQLIEQVLTPDQLALYDGWDGYATIVDYLNTMITHKGQRQLKTLNLLITGAPNTGKTSLFHNPNHKADKSCVQDYCSVYPMGMTHWFPKYQSGVYHMILWNQAKLTSYSYDTILKLLEGSHMDLPTKGGSSRKVDNPLVLLTSNLTLQQLIALKFNYSSQLRALARANLAVRVQNVIVPPGLDLFILQKLLVPI